MEKFQSAKNVVGEVINSLCKNPSAIPCLTRHQRRKTQILLPPISAWTHHFSLTQKNWRGWRDAPAHFASGSYTASLPDSSVLCGGSFFRQSHQKLPSLSLSTLLSLFLFFYLLFLCPRFSAYALLYPLILSRLGFWCTRCTRNFQTSKISSISRINRRPYPSLSVSSPRIEIDDRSSWFEDQTLLHTKMYLSTMH